MQNLTKCGLGLRREHLKDILQTNFKPNFWEITPENWLFMPHIYRADFEKIISDNLIVAHGVSLSIGSNKKPSKKYLKDIKDFLDKYEIKYYSDHISFCGMGSHYVHELLPISLTKSMLNLLCQRVDYVQNELQREIILENATYYYMPEKEMSEVDFINEFLHRSGAKLLLDVNNVYVNSVNHKFDAYKFIDDLKLNNASYIHIAGHLQDDEMFVDTHGEDVSDEVWNLLKYTLSKRKIPCMIERDNHIPPLNVLVEEYDKMCEIWRSV